MRFLGARTEEGEVASWAALSLDPATGTAQIEDLITSQVHLRRGYADAVLTTALRLAADKDCGTGSSPLMRRTGHDTGRSAAASPSSATFTASNGAPPDRTGPEGTGRGPGVRPRTTLERCAGVGRGPNCGSPGCASASAGTASPGLRSKSPCPP
ncbi:GNAT family N-acetyltransferase [Streptomyces sp. NPDC051578]|uniref:GNAT family N-acetyltransferase n=1 Tax=Streptomyces sp. NPDC051578 TaxID=3365662 RepID=UPI0037BBF084